MKELVLNVPYSAESFRCWLCPQVLCDVLSFLPDDNVPRIVIKVEDRFFDKVRFILLDNKIEYSYGTIE